MLVLRMCEQHVGTQADQSQFTLCADDDANSSVTELSRHCHQGIDEGCPFREVLSGATLIGNN